MSTLHDVIESKVLDSISEKYSESDTAFNLAKGTIKFGIGAAKLGYKLAKKAAPHVARAFNKVTGRDKAAAFDLGHDQGTKIPNRQPRPPKNMPAHLVPHFHAGHDAALTLAHRQN